MKILTSKLFLFVSVFVFVPNVFAAPQISRLHSVNLEFRLAPNILFNRAGPTHLEIVQGKKTVVLPDLDGHVYAQDAHYFDALNKLKIFVKPNEGIVLHQDIVLRGQIFLCDAKKGICFSRKVLEKYSSKNFNLPLVLNLRF